MSHAKALVVALAENGPLTKSALRCATRAMQMSKREFGDALEEVTSSGLVHRIKPRTGANPLDVRVAVVTAQGRVWLAEQCR